MATTRKNSLQAARGLFGLAELERLEAPDRAFIGHRDILIRSLARYHFIAPQIRGATLDIGCGRGYGFDIIRSKGRACVGVDLSHDFLRQARKRYPDIAFVRASGERLPLAHNLFKSIICFEVIEHIEDDRGFLHEIRRLAQPDACIAISTPNRLIASGHVAKPLNPFHVREYLAAEFYQLLSSVFTSVALFGQVERHQDTSPTNRFINCIPMHWKYQIPTHIQGLISVALRPPLRLEDCYFETDSLERAHTLIALCRV